MNGNFNVPIKTSSGSQRQRHTSEHYCQHNVVVGATGAVELGAERCGADYSGKKKGRGAIARPTRAPGSSVMVAIRAGAPT